LEHQVIFVLPLKTIRREEKKEKEKKKKIEIQSGFII